jgi:hypothetical protein
MDQIPPRTTPENTAPVRTHADLHRLWRALMGPLGFGGRSLWVLILEPDGRPTGHLLQIEELPAAPDPHMLDDLTRFVSIAVAEVGPCQVAFLLSRPGRDGLTDGDREWAACVQEAVRTEGLPVWPMHRANDSELVVVAPDDLPASA